MNRVVDLHAQDLDIESLREELASFPHRIEEPKRVGGYGGCTPLIAAVLHRNCDLGQVLMSLGARVDATDNRGCSPLHFASATSNIEMLHCLLNAGATINKQNKMGQTPLHIACQLNQVEAAEELVKRRADVSLKDMSRREAFSYLKGVKANVRPKLTALAQMLKKQNPEVATKTEVQVIHESTSSDRPSSVVNAADQAVGVGTSTGSYPAPHVFAAVIAERDEARANVVALQKMVTELQSKLLSYQVEEEEWEAERQELRNVIGTLASQRDDIQGQLNLLNHLWAQNVS